MHIKLVNSKRQWEDGGMTCITFWESLGVGDYYMSSAFLDLPSRWLQS